MKHPVQHKDKNGRELCVGDVVKIENRGTAKIWELPSDSTPRIAFPNGDYGRLKEIPANNLLWVEQDF